jgi:hypothetical protein
VLWDYNLLNLGHTFAAVGKGFDDTKDHFLVSLVILNIGTSSGGATNVETLFEIAFHHPDEVPVNAFGEMLEGVNEPERWKAMFVANNQLDGQTGTPLAHASRPYFGERQDNTFQVDSKDEWHMNNTYHEVWLHLKESTKVSWARINAVAQMDPSARLNPAYDHDDENADELIFVECEDPDDEGYQEWHDFEEGEEDEAYD